MTKDTADRDKRIYAAFTLTRQATTTDKAACERIASEYHLSAKRIGVIVREQKRAWVVEDVPTELTGQLIGAPREDGNRDVPVDVSPDLNPLVDALRRENDALRAKIQLLEAPADSFPKPRGDSAQITTMLDDLRGLQRYARVHVVSDEHMPDHDPRAITMNCLINRYVDPDLTLFNGDEYDFGALSLHYVVDRADGHADAFRAVRPHWQGYVDRMRGRYKLFLDGNHNARLDTFLNMQAQQFGDTLEDEYAALVRYNGKVMWRGGLEEIDIGGLHVHHGERTGENSAKNALVKDFGGAQCVHQGHTHGISVYVHSVKVPGQERFRVVTSVTAGFGGNKPPRYRARKTNLSKWIPASTVYHVDMHSDDVHFTLIPYHETPQGGLVAFYGSKMFKVNAAGEDEQPGKIIPFGEDEIEDAA